MKSFRTALIVVAAAVVALWPRPAWQADAAPSPDDAMTCQQIGIELAPYAKQMGAAFAPLGDTGKQLAAQGQAQVARELPAQVALSAAATATGNIPGANQAVNAAIMAEQQRAWAQAMAEDKPLVDKMNKQMGQAMPQAQAMQNNQRVQHLLDLAKQKNCH